MKYKCVFFGWKYFLYLTLEYADRKDKLHNNNISTNKMANSDAISGGDETHNLIFLVNRLQKRGFCSVLSSSSPLSPRS